jgi:hypothetical protein
MRAAQPRAVNVVQPKFDFEYDEITQELTYKAKTKSRFRQWAAAAFLLLLIPIGAMSALVGFVSVADSPRPDSGGKGLLLLAAGCAISAGLLLVWATKSLVRPIIFNANSITVSGNTYLLEHVSFIGSRPLGLSLLGEIYIIYGAQEIKIITGLIPKDTELVYRKIIDFLGRFGHRFGS